MGRLRRPPGRGYFDALCAYHERGGQLDTAWKVRERHLESVAGRGLLAAECQCRVDRARLLARLGRPLADELAAAREAAARLRDSSWYLARLEEIPGGA